MKYQDFYSCLKMVYNLQELIAMTDIQALSVPIIFIILNSIKVTIYNLYISDEHKPIGIIYKFVYALVTSTLIYTALSFSSRMVLTVFYVAQLIYIAVSISYFNFYHYYLHILQSWELFRESFDVFLHKSVPKNSNQLLSALDLPLLIFLLWISNTNRFSLEILSYRNDIIFSCIAALIVIEIINFTRGQALMQLLKSYPANESQVVANYGIMVNMIIDFCFFYTHDNIVKQYDYGNTKVLKGKDSKRPNIITIQLESVDSNAADICHHGSYVMPFLHSLRQKSIYYPYMMNYHKAGGTSDAEFSIMNSVEPLGNFPSIKIPSYEHANSFVKILGSHTYDTAVFHGNEATYYKRDLAFKNMGYDKFYDMKEMNLKDVGWGAPDHEVFDFVLEKMRKQENPFFYYIITMSNHCSFTNALNYHHNPGFDDIKNKEIRNFYNSLSYVDATIQSFIEKVRAMDGETHIIILGDHTPGLKKKVYKESSLEIGNRHLEFVPLFIVTPDAAIYNECDKVASFLDLAPTILELANINVAYSTYGESLLSPNEMHERIPYRGFLFDRKELCENMEKKKSLRH